MVRRILIYCTGLKLLSFVIASPFSSSIHDYPFIINASAVDVNIRHNNRSVEWWQVINTDDDWYNLSVSLSHDGMNNETYVINSTIASLHDQLYQLVYQYVNFTNEARQDLITHVSESTGIEYPSEIDTLDSSDNLDDNEPPPILVTFFVDTQIDEVDILSVIGNVSLPLEKEAFIKRDNNFNLDKRYKVDHIGYYMGVFKK